MGRLNAGSLRHRATFRVETPGESDGQGGTLEGGEPTDYERWCLVEALKGTQALTLGQELHGTPYQVTARYESQLLAAARIVWNGRTLKVLSLVPAPDTEALTLYALDSGQ